MFSLNYFDLKAKQNFFLPKIIYKARTFTVNNSFFNKESFHRTVTWFQLVIPSKINALRRASGIDKPHEYLCDIYYIYIFFYFKHIMFNGTMVS